MLAGLRRLVLLLAGSSVGVAVVSTLIGVAAGSTLGRALSVGFYVVGAFLIVLGFFAGNRGPLRPRTSGEGEPVAGVFGIGLGARGARKASGEEQQDTLSTAAIFLAVGVWLIFLGVIADTSIRVV